MYISLFSKVMMLIVFQEADDSMNDAGRFLTVFIRAN